MDFMDDLDRKIVNRIQKDFPIHSRPFFKIAEELNLPEKTVIDKVRRMKDNNIIRRIGGNFTPGKVGYYSTLCAARVPLNMIDSFTDVVNSYKGVTHNYLREHDYNVWFTFIEESVEIIENNIREISERTGIDDILNLPATDLFKISANFKV
ncbi:MAG: AsnC family transcriptional regulator [Thermodesulfobacteriota bacterium]